MFEEGPYGPRLAFEERSFVCGYAPRALCVSRFRENVVFVGCKDGSIWVVEPSKRDGFRALGLLDFQIRALGRRDDYGGAIRALCEWDDGNLVIARSGGGLELWPWPDDSAEKTVLSGNADTVRHLLHAGVHRIVVADRDTGLSVLGLDGWRSVSDSPKAIRTILPLQRPEPDEPGAALHFLLTDRGDFYRWNRENETTSFEEGIWTKGRRPSLIADSCLLYDETEGKKPLAAKKMLLATDRGLYLFYLEPSLEAPDGLVLKHRRLPLAGLTATPMALAYSKDARSSREYLWVTDLRGDSHLYWGNGESPPNDHIFWRSGVLHARSETVACAFLAQRDDGSFLVIQARRDDRIVLGHYWSQKRSKDHRPDPSSEISEDHRPDVALRGLLTFEHFGDTRGAEAVRAYLRTADRNFDGEDTNWWTGEPPALISELFETLAEEPSQRQILLESLRASYSDIVQRILSTEKFKTASQLWTLTLLGIIHRTPGDQALSYLGLLRWLRHRQVELESEGRNEGPGLKPERLEEFKRRIDTDLLMARKWGLLGEVNRNREDLVEPQKSLQVQEDALEERVPEIGQELARLRLERLTYGAELFTRSFSLTCEESGGQLRGRSAWATSVLPTGGSEAYVAVSWMWGGIELFRLIADGSRPRFEFRFGHYSSDDQVVVNDRLEPTQIRQEKYGYSRIVHVGKVDRQYYLLSAPVTLPASKLIVRSLECPEKFCDTKLEEGDSIYSLLELGEGLLVAGLRGSEGRPRLALLKISLAGAEELPEVTVVPLDILPVGTQTPAIVPLNSPIGRNRVWALAKMPDPPEGFRVAVGCDSGEIFAVEIDPEGQKVRKVIPVGRMGSPVQALRCSEVPRSQGSLARIFAGGEDGAIVSWQELDRVGEDRRDRDAGAFGTLWATVESGPISDIHVIEGESPLVLALSRKGRYVAFDDSSRIAGVESATLSGPKRVPVPGTRHGRRPFGFDAFASSLVQRGENFQVYSDLAMKLGAFASLVVATGDGRLHLVSLHSPEHTPERKRQHENLLALSRQVLVEPIHFRLPEAVYKASPTLSLILVRFLLDETDLPQGLSEAPWYLPRHVRPLLDLRLAWDLVRKVQVFAAGDLTGRIREPLSAALKRAWHLDDLDLFKEICQVVLRRVNKDLFLAAQATMEKDIRKQVAHDVFIEVLDAVERALPRWLGADRRREARARATVAKHLVDGETFWALLGEAARERDDQAAKPLFDEVLSERFRSVRELVNKRDPMVSLESLRAANLSLARLCRRLSNSRKVFLDEEATYYPPQELVDRDSCEARWEVIQGYFEELTAAAARTFRTPLELNDALAHEFARTFALFICACPSATLRIAARLTEQQLVATPEFEEGFPYNVRTQLKVLAQIGLDTPDWAEALFRLGTESPQLNASPQGEVSAVLKRKGVFIEKGGQQWPLDVEKLGRENLLDLENLATVFELVRELEDLAIKLETNAQGIDLSAGWILELFCYVVRLSPAYAETQDFWCRAFVMLPELNTKTEDDNARRVRPETILHCRVLASWAETSVRDLEKRAREGRLFQPEVASFSRTLRRLATAAKAFPTSAAVQTNIVQGVLGHHLLEDLDEHALELEEIAEVLNPRKVWDFRDGGRRPLSVRGEGDEESTAERFASYLLGRAEAAGSIPKSLRSLMALLGSTEEPTEEPGDLWRLLDTMGWKLEPFSSLPLTVKEERFLALAFSELDQNHRKHGVGGVVAQVTEARLDLQFSFDVLGEGVKDSNSNWSRLLDLQKSGPQQPMSPKQSRDVASTGTGFYLASLAAAIVGWELKVHSVPHEGTWERITFHVEFSRLAETILGQDP